MKYSIRKLQGICPRPCEICKTIPTNYVIDMECAARLYVCDAHRQLAEDYVNGVFSRL